MGHWQNIKVKYPFCKHTIRAFMAKRLNEILTLREKATFTQTVVYITPKGGINNSLFYMSGHKHILIRAPA